MEKFENIKEEIERLKRINEDLEIKITKLDLKENKSGFFERGYIREERHDVLNHIRLNSIAIMEMTISLK